MINRKIMSLEIDLRQRRIALNRAELDKLELEAQLGNKLLSEQDYSTQVAELQKRHSELSFNVLTAETELLELKNERMELEVRQPWRFVWRRFYERDYSFYLSLGLLFYTIWLLNE